MDEEHCTNMVSLNSHELFAITTPKVLHGARCQALGSWAVLGQPAGGYIPGTTPPATPQEQGNMICISRQVQASRRAAIDSEGQPIASIPLRWETAVWRAHIYGGATWHGSVTPSGGLRAPRIGI